MKRKGLYIATLSPLFVFTLIGCTGSKIDSSTESFPNDSCGEWCDNPLPEYLQLWEQSNAISFDIRMSQQAAEFINQYQYNHDDSTYFDYYVPCDVIVSINSRQYTFEEVGIRQKGNMSRRHMLEDGNFSLNTLAHYKLSFKQTFDGDEYDNIAALQPFKKEWADSSARKARKNRTLFEMEKIDIKWNRNDDQTKVRQSYAYKIFRENGVLAGHSTLANVTIGINGKTPINTTYEVLECIDESFIKKNFLPVAADGDLYKCTYTEKGPANFSSYYTVGDQIGVEDNTKKYHPAYDLKTNKKKNTTHETLLNLRTAINNTTMSADEYKTNIEQYVNIYSFLKYEAIAFLLGNFDDMRNNANNYYLYIDSKDHIGWFIPYDFDRCLGAGCEGRKDYMTDFSAESTKMQCNGDWQSINLYWRTVCTSTNSDSGHSSVERVEAYRTYYQNAIEELLNKKIISVESFTSYVNSFPESYRGNPNGAGEGNTTFANYLSKKINAIKTDTYTSGYDIKV